MLRTFLLISGCMFWMYDLASPRVNFFFMTRRDRFPQNSGWPEWTER